MEKKEELLALAPPLPPGLVLALALLLLEVLLLEVLSVMLPQLLSASN